MISLRSLSDALIKVMIEDRARKIKMLLLDVDGVLTDGRIIYDDFGGQLRSFDVQDGFGFVLLKRAGIKSIIITGRKSRSLRLRASHLQVSKVYQNAFNKINVYDKILKKFGLHGEQICYIGDDLMDAPILKRVGLAVVVANGVDAVKDSAHYVTKKEGGRGAVREVVEIILKAQGKWVEVAKEYVG